MGDTEGGVELGILSLRCLWNVTAQTGALRGREGEDAFKMAAKWSLSFMEPQRVLVVVTATPD